VATVLIDGKPAAIVGDQSAPCSLPGYAPGGPGMIQNGPSTVKIGKKPAARVDDLTRYAFCTAPNSLPVGKVLPPGCPTVIIND